MSTVSGHHCTMNSDDGKTTTIIARYFQLRKARHFLVKNHLHNADNK